MYGSRSVASDGGGAAPPEALGDYSLNMYRWEVGIGSKEPPRCVDTSRSIVGYVPCAVLDLWLAMVV
jgi:hypothetical protein